MTKPLIMVLLKSPFDGKNPSWKFRAAAQCASLRVPFPSFTKASNRVENLLEARGLGLQLFFKGLSRENGGTYDPPSLCILVCAAFRQTQPETKPLQLDPEKPPPLISAASLLPVLQPDSRLRVLLRSVHLTEILSHRSNAAH